MPTFPISITQKFLEATLSRTHENNRADFNPEVGSPIRRKRYALVTPRYPLSASMMLNDEQRDDLEEFYEVTCESGVLSFDWTDYNSVAHTYEWIEPPNYVRVAPNVWRVELSLAEL